MKSLASIPLGPWINGIQNVNDPAMTPKGCVVEADNVLIDSDGTVHPRLGYDLVAVGGHSLFRHGDKTYAIFEKKVCEIYENGARTLSPIEIEGRVTWGVLNDEPVFTNSTILARISGGKVKRIGVETPITSQGGAATDGVLLMGAVSFVNEDGEEGPLSAVFVGASPVSTPTDPSVTRMRLYAPPTSARYNGDKKLAHSGDMLYFVQETAVSGSVTAPMLDDKYEALGKPAETMNKARMPGGSYVRYWRGRLLVARGRTLYISDPLRYGLYDLSGGFVTFEARIDFIEPVEGGVFVALRNAGVHFLAGDSPQKWERKVADVIPAQAGASLVIPAAQMKLPMQPKPEWVAVWLTHKGFAIGLPSGNVFYPQADLLSGLPLGTGSLHFEGDRLIALSQ